MHEAWVLLIEVGLEVHRRLIAEGEIVTTGVVAHHHLNSPPERTTCSGGLLNRNQIDKHPMAGYASRRT